MNDALSEQIFAPMRAIFEARKAARLASLERSITLNEEGAEKSSHLENAGRVLKIGSILVPTVLLGTALTVDIMGGSGAAAFTLAGLKAFILAHKVPIIAGAAGTFVGGNIEVRAGDRRVRHENGARYSREGLREFKRQQKQEKAFQQEMEMSRRWSRPPRRH